MRRASVAALAPIALAACQALAPQVEMAPTQAVRPPVVAQPAVNNGAIFQGASYRPPFEDHRAPHPGEKLTVHIVQKVSASHN